MLPSEAGRFIHFTIIDAGEMMDSQSIALRFDVLAKLASFSRCTSCVASKITGFSPYAESYARVDDLDVPRFSRREETSVACSPHDKMMPLLACADY